MALTVPRGAQGWVRYWDAAKSAHYYHHAESQQTQWAPPPIQFPPAAAAPTHHGPAATAALELANQNLAAARQIAMLADSASAGMACVLLAS